MRARRGYSLVECLVMISLISITLGTVATTLHSMNRAERRVRGDVEHSEVVDRFASQLRTDSHQASSATLVANDSKTMRLVYTDGKSVEYTLSERGVDRIVRLKDAIQHRDSFTMRMEGATRWELDTNRYRPLITVQVPLFSGGDPKQLSPATARLQAAVNIGGRPAGGEPR